jgi:PAS domain S-box-containing protein
MTRGLSAADSFGFEAQPFRQGRDYALYRGKEVGSQKKVLGVAVSGRRSAHNLDRLKQEYLLADKLDSAWAVQPIDLVRHEGQPILVLEDPGGEPLDWIIEQHQEAAIDLGRFLRIAIGMAAALGGAHRQGLIHKDVKPANALVDRFDRVWLMGFGIASQLPRERQTPRPPETIAGTLAYMAPEQTGRVNRNIDSRSDLYSLGVTLYELLTGTLPFNASEPMEWVHCQIARLPKPPSERRPDIPETVSAIIMKLLAKSAEERFQTAAGLERDLRRCLQEWDAHGRVEMFSPGENDVPGHLLIPEKLYGRASERNGLLAPFDRVVEGGKPELILISGYSGIGKSSLVHETFGTLAPPRGLFAAGKFDQYMRDIPYATLAQAFQSLVSHVLSKQGTELLEWQEAFNAALGANGALLADLVPELELIVGKQPQVSGLSPKEAQLRFRTVVRRFISAFARPRQPLVIFLDDLQWVDTATLDLLEDLMTQGDVRDLLLIGAYRHNEVDATHRLVPKLASLHAAGASVETISLGPLRDADLGRIIGDALRCDQEHAYPLAELIHDKTGGNPFFAVQFLQALEDEGLLFFDHANLSWAWDAAGIRAKGYSDNVVNLMVASLNRLASQSLLMLCHLACFGTAANVGFLAEVCQTSPEDVREALREAVRAGMLMYSDEVYAFQHDRIQEAAYSLLDDDARAEIHIRIGRLLLAQTPPEERDGVIFQIVSQFNQSSTLLSSSGERAEVAQLNLLAARRSKNAAAYASALSFLSAARALLTKECWNRQYSLVFGIELQHAECEFLTGELLGAEDRLSKLASRAANLVDQAAVACLLVDLYIILGRPAHAFEVGLEFLKKVGFELSPHPADVEVEEQYQRIWKQLGTRPIEDLGDLPEMKNPNMRAAIDVLNRLVLSAVYQDPRLHKLLIALMVNVSIEHGNSAASSVGYVSLGRVLIHDFGDYSSALRFGQLSLDLVDKPGFEAFKGRVYFSFGTGISSWAQHLRLGRSFIERALDEATKNGDLAYIGYCHSNIVGNMISSGDTLTDVDYVATEGLDFARRSGSRIAASYIIGQLRLIRSLRGLPCDFRTFDGNEFEEETFERRLGEAPNPAIVADLYWSRRMQAHVFMGDYAAALEAAARLQTLFLQPLPNLEGADYHFYAALAHAGSLDADPSYMPEQTLLHLEALRAHHRQLRDWADNRPVNFESRAALVGAELARSEGREREGELLYAQAIRSARANGFLNVEAIACEKAARSYAVRGFEDIAEMYLSKARDAYQTWGAQGALQRLSASDPKIATAGAINDNMSTPPSDQQFDVAAVVKASLALSGEMLLPQLIEKLMRIMVEHAGAERGVLVMVRDGQPQIEAEAVTEFGEIEVAARSSPITPSDLPQSVLQYAMRTHQRVLLDDASSTPVYFDDDYLRLKHSRSVLCLLIVRQTKLVGALYLENGLMPGAFTKERVDVLELLASQAAVSLENAGLYTDLQRSETFLTQGEKISHTGSFGWSSRRRHFFWSEELYAILEYDQSVVPSADRAIERIHPDDRRRFRACLDDAMTEGKDFDSEYRLSMPDGRIKHIHTTGRAVRAENLDFVTSVRDVTERVRTEERLREAQSELAHVARVTALNAMTASIAHEVSQPLSGILTNANTGARLLAANPPDLISLAETIRRTIRDANRASDVIKRLRAMFQKQAPTLEMVDLNEAAQEVIALSAGEVQRSRAILRTEFAEQLPFVRADRVQLQQVILNLVLNAIEAVADVQDRARTITLRTYLYDGATVRLDVQDSGMGVPPEAMDRLFDAFYTTKVNGMGVGLSICRSIIENLEGRLWVATEDRPGATFSFCIPTVLREAAGAIDRNASSDGSEIPLQAYRQHELDDENIRTN